MTLGAKMIILILIQFSKFVKNNRGVELFIFKFSCQAAQSYFEINAASKEQKPHYASGCKHHGLKQFSAAPELKALSAEECHYP